MKLFWIKVGRVYNDKAVASNLPSVVLLLAAGQKDMRFALPNSRIMLHQPSGGFQGQATDIMLHAQEILNLKKRLNEISSATTS